MERTVLKLLSEKGTEQKISILFAVTSRDLIRQLADGVSGFTLFFCAHVAFEGAFMPLLSGHVRWYVFDSR